MDNSKTNKKHKLDHFTWTIMGMFVGLFGGGLVFYNFVTTKGWNPLGWWILLTFIAMVLGGFAGLFICEILSKKIERSSS